MQITFQTHYPKQINGSLVYERTHAQIKTDSIDDLLDEAIQNVSKQISDEPTIIIRHPNVTFSDFNFSEYHSKKTINLYLLNVDNYSVSPFTLQITVYFDTADALFIDSRVKDEQTFNLSQTAFNMLNTLITR